MAKWFINMKKADFNGIARKYGVSTVIARIMRNREVRTDEEINLYLNGTPGDLYDGRLMKDMECAVSILKEKIAEEKKIRIIGDYDIDGVNSTYILQKGLELAEKLECWFMAYKENWRATSKEGDLHHIAEIVFWYADWMRRK